MKAAAEGRWEEIQQVFYTPSQEAVVLNVRNKVIWTEQCMQSLSLLVSFEFLCTFLFNAVWLESASHCCLPWPLEFGKEAHQGVQAFPRSAEQGTSR